MRWCSAATRKKGEAQRKKQHQVETPTCLGLPAATADHSGEIVGAHDDVLIGDDGENEIFASGGRLDRIFWGTDSHGLPLASEHRTP